jgi:hypothetical protein
MDALRSLGFQHDPRVIFDECPGLAFDFGDLALRASTYAGTLEGFGTTDSSRMQ